MNEARHHDDLVEVVARWLARLGQHQPLAHELIDGVRSAMADGRVKVSFIPASTFGRSEDRLEIVWRGRTIGEIPWSPAPREGDLD